MYFFLDFFKFFFKKSGLSNDCELFAVFKGNFVKIGGNLGRFGRKTANSLHFLMIFVTEYYDFIPFYRILAHDFLHFFDHRTGCVVNVCADTRKFFKIRRRGAVRGNNYVVPALNNRKVVNGIYSFVFQPVDDLFVVNQFFVSKARRVSFRDVNRAFHTVTKSEMFGFYYFQELVLPLLFRFYFARRILFQAAFFCNFVCFYS